MQRQRKMQRKRKLRYIRKLIEKNHEREAKNEWKTGKETKQSDGNGKIIKGLSKRWESTMRQKQVVLRHLIIHFPTSLRVSERMSEQMSAAVWSKEMSERCEQMS